MVDLILSPELAEAARMAEPLGGGATGNDMRGKGLQRGAWNPTVVTIFVPARALKAKPSKLVSSAER